MARFQVGDIIRHYDYEEYFLILRVGIQSSDCFYYDTYNFSSGFINLNRAISEFEDDSAHVKSNILELFKGC